MLTSLERIYVRFFFEIISLLSSSLGFETTENENLTMVSPPTTIGQGMVISKLSVERYSNDGVVIVVYINGVLG